MLFCQILLYIFFRDIFSLGFGPFRWICLSGLASDLEITDKIAGFILENIMEQGLPDNIAVQYRDNIKWIKEAGRNHLVVGAQARILYADQRARVAIALAFNQAIRGCCVYPFFFFSLKKNKQKKQCECVSVNLFST